MAKVRVQRPHLKSKDPPAKHCFSTLAAHRNHKMYWRVHVKNTKTRCLKPDTLIKDIQLNAFSHKESFYNVKQMKPVSERQIPNFSFIHDRPTIRTKNCLGDQKETNMSRLRRFCRGKKWSTYKHMYLNEDALCNGFMYTEKRQ